MFEWKRSIYHLTTLQLSSKEKKASNFRCSLLCGKGGIRTPGASQHGGFQDRCNRPLYHLSSALCRCSFSKAMQRYRYFLKRASLSLFFFEKSWKKLIFLRFQLIRARFLAILSTLHSIFHHFTVPKKIFISMWVAMLNWACKQYLLSFSRNFQFIWGSHLNLK